MAVAAAVREELFFEPAGMVTPFLSCFVRFVQLSSLVICALRAWCF